MKAPLPLVLLGLCLSLTWTTPLRAADQKTFTFTENGVPRSYYLAENEVYIQNLDSLKLRDPKLLETWLSKLVKDGKFMEYAGNTALVSIPVPQDYARWLAGLVKSSLLTGSGNKIEIQPVLYTPTPSQEAVNPDTHEVTSTPVLARMPELRVISTNKVGLEAKSREEAQALADSVHAESVQSTIVSNYYLLTFSTAYKALQAAAQLNSADNNANPVFQRPRKLRSTGKGSLYSQQWHLNNTAIDPQSNKLLAGTDIQVEKAWDITRGAGVTVGVIDGLIDTGHPDLVPNMSQGPHINLFSYPFTYSDISPADFSLSFPSSFNSYSGHGTAVAGLIGAADIGASGVAPLSQLIGICMIDTYPSDGLRLEGGNNFTNSIFVNTINGLQSVTSLTTDDQEAFAFNYQSNIISIYNNSWGPPDDSLVLSKPGPLASAVLQKNAMSGGPNGSGIVYVWAGGDGANNKVQTSATATVNTVNADAFEDGSNFDGYANSIYTLAVGAINGAGKAATYSEQGTNLVVCAPSGDIDNSVLPDILTTDARDTIGYNTATTANGGDYTNTFKGTSASAAMVSGVVALMQSVNPALTPRDIKEILIRTAKKNDPTDSLWVKNNAGFHFNEHYGAGLVQAGDAVKIAQQWKNLDPQISITAPANTTERTIQAITYTGQIGSVSTRFDMTQYQNIRIEQATVTIDLDESSDFGGLSLNNNYFDILLISPDGTKSYLARAIQGASPLKNWTFSTVNHWGETSYGASGSGKWTLIVDQTLYAGISGQLHSVGLTLYGTPISIRGDFNSITLPASKVNNSGKYNDIVRTGNFITNGVSNNTQTNVNTTLQTSNGNSNKLNTGLSVPQSQVNAKTSPGDKNATLFPSSSN